jgi:hypothetical protein
MPIRHTTYLSCGGDWPGGSSNPRIARKGIEPRRPPGTASVGDRENHRLAAGLPPPDHPLRTPIPRNYLAFLGLAAAITSYERLIKLTM